MQKGNVMLAKLLNGKWVPCPKQGRDGRGGLHMDLPRFYTDNPHRAAEDGYYPVQRSDCGLPQRYGGTADANGEILRRLDRIEEILREIGTRRRTD